MVATLGELLRNSGKTYQELSRLSGLSKPRIGQLALNQFVRTPSRKTVKGLARALDLTESQVLQSIWAVTGENNGEYDPVALAERIALLPNDKRKMLDIIITALERA